MKPTWVRVSARSSSNHDRSQPARIDRVHVLFAPSDDGTRPQHYTETRGFYMSRETYRAVQQDNPTPQDYGRIGAISPAPPDYEWTPADPQTISVQAGAFGVPNSIVREQPEQPRLIGGGTLPLDTLPLFGGEAR